ncbi:thiamine pyrophosphate-dependent dehydrogenase E1 component subunit alpha [Paenibacillus piscarius]|uniref:thiamine pyrophosphate-dependent dehydrogenase E1 component subunit alpha n=1 Tax=Paenibacillus piscarius TaxID=1089681 RepID=UPI001EE7E45B|nr:thiamine pyrophosphate-dependent dehydrogenase E1 component subunit alpha [Paenibacillus piscarius]
MNRHLELGLTEETVINMYTHMLQGRKFDERALLLQRMGKVSFHIAGIGQEAAQVGAAFALKMGVDFLLPYYRDNAFVLSAGMSLQDLFLSIFAKSEDPNSGGRQSPGHFSTRRLNIVTGSTPVATQISHAVGFALALRMKQASAVSFVTFGEGSSNQGEFHEACNFAGVFSLPVIMMCENNQYSISTPYQKQIGGGVPIASRAKAYGFKGIRVNGNDIFEVYEAVKAARERAIDNEGATLIEAVTYRCIPHSSSDNDLIYRSKEEVELHSNDDGIKKLKNYMLKNGFWSEEVDKNLHNQINSMINEAVDYAEKARYPNPEDTLLHVYANE